MDPFLLITIFGLGGMVVMALLGSASHLHVGNVHLGHGTHGHTAHGAHHGQAGHHLGQAEGEITPMTFLKLRYKFRL